MNEETRWVDRPKPRFPWPLWLFTAGFLAFFVSFPFRAGVPLVSGAGLFWIVLSVVGTLLIGWSYFGVRYELDDGTLKARAGVNRMQLQIAEIQEIDITPWYTFVHPRNLGAGLLFNSWKPILRVVDSSGRKLLLTPTDPEEMRAEILRQRDRLRGGRDA